MAHDICELLWLRFLFSELSFPVFSLMCFYCDNKVAISIAHNLIQHDCTKHIEVDRYFIREKLISGIICTLFIQTEDQLAGIFTKGLGHDVFLSLTSKLGLFNVFRPA